MSSITELLDRYFFEMTYDKDATEVIQLLALDEEELTEKFNNRSDLCVKYGYNIKENVMTNMEGDKESSSSDSEEESDSGHFNLKTAEVGQGSTTTDNPPRTAKRKKPMEDYWGLQPPRVPGSSTPDGMKTLNIDCTRDFDQRRRLIDLWATELSLIIQSNKDEFATAKPVLLLADHKSEGIVQMFIDGAHCTVVKVQCLCAK